MTRRTALQTLASLAAPAVLRGARKPGDKPNLLFIWTDQQRADTMAAYGNHRYRVPALNRLAAESVVFQRCYVTQPVCTPSRSSVMTGWWPHRTGCVRNNIPLPASIKTLPELLGDSAYRTAYMGKWHLGDEHFAQHGFERWVSIEDIYNQYFSPGRDRASRSSYHHFLLKLGYKPDGNNQFSRRFATTVPVEHSKPSFLAQEAVKFILEHRREPWILYVNTLEPHTPFSSALNDLHSEEEAPLPPNYPGIPEGPEPAWYKARRKQFIERKTEGFDLRTPEGWKRMHRNYAGLCSLVDQAFARILWALEVSGQAENTIVVHTSDHGEMMGAHSLMAKSVMYEEAVRVPLLLRAPFRIPRPRQVACPVSHVDLVPTLLELMNVRDPGLDGQSLLGYLSGDRMPGDVFIEWTADPSEGGPNGRAVVTPDGWKLVLHDNDVSMLFDRNRDPLEMRNLYGAPETKQLRAKIEAWQRKTQDKLALPS